MTTTIADLADREDLDELALCGAVRHVTGLALVDPSDPDEPWPALALHQSLALTHDQLHAVIALAVSTTQDI